MQPGRAEDFGKVLRRHHVPNDGRRRRRIPWAGFWAVLLHGKVAQVREPVTQVIEAVLSSGEPQVEVRKGPNHQWADRSDRDPEANVEFAAVDQEGPLNVFLHDGVEAQLGDATGNVSDGREATDTAPAAQIPRLYNPHGLLAVEAAVPVHSVHGSDPGPCSIDAGPFFPRSHLPLDGLADGGDTAPRSNKEAEVLRRKRTRSHTAHRFAALHPAVHRTEACLEGAPRAKHLPTGGGLRRLGKPP
mmetsp:Transcript_27972/g.81881  ORF Transcript_27972/g.81881 Transcript_27972/m.81881 type:complete len:245 (-) Transcript_27972:89-823(-)